MTERHKTGDDHSAIDLSTADWNRLDEAVQRFEKAWSRGKPPNLDRFLPKSGVEDVPCLAERLELNVPKKSMSSIWPRRSTEVLSFPMNKKVNSKKALQRTLPESIASWQHIAREPTPSEAAMLVETMESMLASLQGRQRTILELSLQGMTTQAISDELECSVRTVERTLERVRKKLDELSKSDS